MKTRSLWRRRRRKAGPRRSQWRDPRPVPPMSPISPERASIHRRWRPWRRSIPRACRSSTAIRASVPALPAPASSSASPQLFRPRCRNRRHRAVRADHLHEGNLAISGPNDDLIIPRGSEKTDWEVELASSLGRTGEICERKRTRSITSPAIATNHDVSERAFQIERQGQWTKGKSCDTSARRPLAGDEGEVPDPQNLSMWLKSMARPCRMARPRTMVYGVRPSRLLSLAVHVAAAGRHHLHRHAAGCGHGHEAAAYLEAGRCHRTRHRRFGYAEADRPR